MTDTATLENLLEREGYTSLPLTRTAVGHMRVDGLINGAPEHFLVDTGASATVIDRESAMQRSLAAHHGGATAIGCVGGGGEAAVRGSADKATLGELPLGSLHLSNISVHVIDLSHVNAALETHGAGRIDGVIGADLMDSHRAVIAYAERRLHLRS